MLVSIILYIILLVIIFEIIMSIIRQYNRYTIYNKAYNLSRKLNKPLLVIGDPNNGFMGKYLKLSYPCGDLCLDIVGCKKCKNYIQGDALLELKKMPNNSYIIFESCVLESIEDNKSVIDEINRVSGNKYFQVRIGLSIIHFGYLGGYFTGESTKIYSVPNIKI